LRRANTDPGAIESEYFWETIRTLLGFSPLQGVQSDGGPFDAEVSAEVQSFDNALLTAQQAIGTFGGYGPEVTADATAQTLSTSLTEMAASLGSIAHAAKSLFASTLATTTACAVRAAEWADAPALRVPDQERGFEEKVDDSAPASLRQATAVRKAPERAHSAHNERAPTLQEKSQTNSKNQGSSVAPLSPPDRFSYPTIDSVH
jgi:hypothetical protein